MAASVIWKRFFSLGSKLNSPRIALVLSGNGVYDGSEIHEASACLVHLSRGGASIDIYAPDILQMHVIDHTKGEPNAKDSRNVLVESARIARGKIQPLTDLHASSHDAVIFPGGFGVAKNLSNFAVAGKDCKVNPQVEKVIKDFHSSKKPIGLCCIAPILAAKLIPNVEITLGMDKDDGAGTWPYSGTVETVKQWNATHRNANVDGVIVDKKNLVVTTPAFMCNTDKFHLIYDGIGNMVKAVLNLAAK